MSDRSATADAAQFQPVDEKDADKFMAEALRSVASVMMWSKEQKHVVNTNIRAIDGENKVVYVWVPSDLDPTQFVASLDALGSRECFFSVSLARAMVFFRTTCLGHDSGGFRFQVPKQIYKVQRRKDFRLMIPFGQIIKVDFPDPMVPDQRLSKKLFDLSSGGISFVASDKEALIFHNGLKLENVVFSIRSRKIICDVEVRHIKPQPEGSSAPGVKIGMSFSKIDAGNVAWISAFVFEESRKYFTKMA